MSEKKRKQASDPVEKHEGIIVTGDASVEDMEALPAKQLANSIDMASSLEEKRSFAIQMIKSGLLPVNLASPDHLDDPDLKERAVGGVIAVVEYGREMGISPWVALHGMHIVQGKVVMGIHMYVGLALKNDILIDVVEDWKPLHNAKKEVVNHRTTVEITRKHAAFGGMVKTYSHSKRFSEIKEAGLADRDVYKRMKRLMFRTRCITEALRLYAADVFMGAYEETELMDVEGRIYDVDEDGKVITNN